ncbi:MAG: hypothetical protein AVDCRST_MAG95-1007, partial [uncultured Adhaeribacter sp.]
EILILKVKRSRIIYNRFTCEFIKIYQFTKLILLLRKVLVLAFDPPPDRSRSFDLLLLRIPFY